MKIRSKSSYTHFVGNKIRYNNNVKMELLLFYEIILSLQFCEVDTLTQLVKLK